MLTRTKMSSSGSNSYCTTTTSSVSLSLSTLSMSESEDNEREHSTGSTSTTISFLDRLRSPTPSDLAKKRTTKRNPPRNAKCLKPPKSAHNPKTVTPAMRAAQYSEEPFVVSRGKLFCEACREEVGLKKSVINKHVWRSNKHSAGKERLAKKGKQKKDIVEALSAYNAKEH